MFLWTGVISCSLLFHELARCLAGCALGYRGRIVLTALGPNTRFEPEPALGPFVLLRLAGPIASLTIGSALACAGGLSSQPAANWMVVGMSFNLVWTGINLLPIGPFEGGRVLQRLLGKHRSSTAMLVSMMVAEATASATFVVLRSPALGVLVLAAGIASTLQWRKCQRRILEDQALAGLREARAHLQAGGHSASRDIAKTVAASACSAATRDDALHVLAWAALGDGDPDAARKVLGALRPGVVDAYTLAAVESANGCPSRAIEALDRGRHGPGLSRDAARFLVDLHAQAGDFKRVAAAAMDLSDVLGPEDVRRVARVLTEAGELHFAVAVIGVICRPSPSEPRSPSSMTRLDKPILRK
jgi:hypothetical protein